MKASISMTDVASTMEVVMDKTTVPTTLVDKVLDYLPYTLALLYIAVSPYTKVEESFNLQAMHDMLHLGADVAQYDHHTFPGVVHRTFLGPFFVAIISVPLTSIGILLGGSKFIHWFIVRAVLACLMLGVFQGVQEGGQEKVWRPSIYLFDPPNIVSVPLHVVLLPASTKHHGLGPIPAQPRLLAQFPPRRKVGAWSSSFLHHLRILLSPQPSPASHHTEVCSKNRHVDRRGRHGAVCHLLLLLCLLCPQEPG